MPRPSLGRTSSILALLLVGTGCEQPQLSLLEAGFEVPELWPPNRRPVPPTAVTEIKPSEVALLEPIQLEDGPPLKTKTVSLGKPKVLLPKAKGTYYPAKHPLSDRRAMVSRVREDKHGRVLETYEAYLVDFEDGVVERFDSLSPYDQYSEAGIGFAWKTIDGVKTKVLVHADGLVIPMWPETDTAPDLLLHPVWQQAWIFGVEEHPTPDPFDDPEETERRSVYIHWTDLRRPPPSGPKVVLPFSFRFDPRVINNESRSVHGPRPKQQADVPFVLSGDLRGCMAVELDKKGGFHCRRSSYTTLAEGWGYTTFEDENFDTYVELQNRETGEVQIIRGDEEGDDCWVKFTVMKPPRALVGCDNAKHLLWTPSEVLSPGADDGGNGSWESDDKLLLTSFERIQGEFDTVNYARGWLDLEYMMDVFAPATANRGSSGFPYHGRWLFTEGASVGELFTSRLGGESMQSFNAFGKCPRLVGFPDWHLDSVLLACWGPPPNPRSLVGFDPELAKLFRLPGADNRESLITATHVLSTRGRQRELIAWSRSGVWPTSSRE